jgi:hypothetical protein
MSGINLDVDISPPLFFIPYNSSKFEKHPLVRRFKDKSVDLSLQDIALFLISLPRLYVCSQWRQQKEYKHVCQILDPSRSTKIFDIKFKSYETFHVFTHQMPPELRFTFDPSRSLIILRNNNAAEYEDMGDGYFLQLPKPVPRQHPYVHIAQYLWTKVRPEVEQAFDRPIFSADPQRVHKLHISNIYELKPLLDSLKRRVFVTTDSEGASPYTCDGRKISAITFLAPWASHVIAQAQYIQLDASFQGASPYVYSVPQPIICNEAYPIGFTLGPSEAHFLYQTFYAAVARSISPENFQDLIHLPVLSDEGSAVISFCDSNSITQFFCVCHLIRKFGTNGFLHLLVSSMLYIETEDILVGRNRPQGCF